MESNVLIVKVMMQIKMSMIYSNIKMNNLYIFFILSILYLFATDICVINGVWLIILSELFTENIWKVQ